MLMQHLESADPLLPFALAFSLTLLLSALALAPIEQIIPRREDGQRPNLRLNAISRAIGAWHRLRWILTGGAFALVLGMFSVIGLSNILSLKDELRRAQQDIAAVEDRFERLRERDQEAHREELRQVREEHRDRLEDEARDQQTRDQMRRQELEFLTDRLERDADDFNEDVEDMHRHLIEYRSLYGPLEGWPAVPERSPRFEIELPER